MAEAYEDGKGRHCRGGYDGKPERLPFIAHSVFSRSFRLDAFCDGFAA
jgi:hypothetical protein